MKDERPTDDIYSLPAEGGEPKKVTFDSAGDQSPAFSADGNKIYFIRSEGGDFSAGERPQSNLMVVLLEKQEKDPDEANANSEATDNSPEAIQQRLGEPRRGNSAVTNPKPPTIDWAGLKRRTRNVLRAGGTGGTGGGRGGRGGGAGGGGLSVMTYTPARDGRTMVFGASS